MVIAEADLRAEDDDPAAPRDRLVETSAEWFVTDWYTRDGSQETVRSIRAVLSADIASASLPHEAADLPGTFVEWAKTIGTEYSVDGRIDVTVVYRLIRETDDGFVREPVKTVTIALVRTNETVEVVSLPPTEAPER